MVCLSLMQFFLAEIDGKLITVSNLLPPDESLAGQRRFLDCSVNKLKRG